MTATRMILFQSVDLEGSTAYKQRHAEAPSQKWLTVIEDFLENFPQKYRANLDSIQRTSGVADCAKPVLWKVLGDELIFKAEIARGEEVKLLTEAFFMTLEGCNAEIDLQHQIHRERCESIDSAGLRMKGSSWTAGFPVTNAVIHTDFAYDYIGPSMDMGFRLGAFANAQRLAISVELAWLLGTFGVELPFHFAGRTPVKGVAEGVGYPRLWIEVPSTTYYQKERELVGGEQLKPDILKDLCCHFIKEHGAPGYLPFLVGEPGKTAMPEYYSDRLNLIREKRSSMLLREGDHAPAPRVESREVKDREMSQRLSRLTE